MGLMLESRAIGPALGFVAPVGFLGLDQVAAEDLAETHVLNPDTPSGSPSPAQQEYPANGTQRWSHSPLALDEEMLLGSPA